MSIKTPPLWQLVSNIGISEGEITQMSASEFMSLVVIAGSEFGSTFEEIKNKLEVSQPNAEKKEPKIQAQLPDSDQEVQVVEIAQSSEQETHRVYISQSQIRRLKSNREIATERSLGSVAELNEFRLSLVKALTIPDKVRYIDKLTMSIKEMQPEPSTGTNVTLLLHEGTKMIRNFSPKANASDLYYWSANHQSMIKDQIKLGSFVIVDINGKEVDPELPISALLPPKAAQLFVRLIY